MVFSITKHIWNAFTNILTLALAVLLFLSVLFHSSLCEAVVPEQTHSQSPAATAPAQVLPETGNFAANEWAMNTAPCLPLTQECASTAGHSSGSPEYSLLLLILWIITTGSIGVNYLLYKSQERACLFGVAASLSISNLLMPHSLGQSVPSAPLIAMYLIMLCGATYFLCRLAHLWLLGSPRYGRSIARTFALLHYGLIVAILAISVCMAIAPETLLSQAACIAISLGLIIVIMASLSLRCLWPPNTQAVLLLCAAMCLLSLMALPGLPFYRAISETDLVNHFGGLIVIALLALAIATRNRKLRLLEGRLHSIKVSNLEQQSRDLRSSLLKLSGRLQADKNNRNRMLRLLGHDLRSPIASLQTFADILIEKKGSIPEEEIHSVAHEIKRTCALQLELLHNLLSLSSGSAPGIPPKPGILELNVIAMRAWNNIADLAHRKRIRLIRDIGTGQCVYTDPDALQTILRNLFANAVKFSHPDSTIRISTQKAHAGHITLVVEDKGVGIGKKQLATLFDDELFSTRGTQGEKGIGIGLKLCFDLACANQSELTLTSSPGKGTCVTLTMPVCAPDIQDGQQPANASEQTESSIKGR